jgi:hypothetical protein
VTDTEAAHFGFMMSITGRASRARTRPYALVRRDGPKGLRPAARVLNAIERSDITRYLNTGEAAAAHRLKANKTRKG